MILKSAITLSVERRNFKHAPVYVDILSFVDHTAFTPSKLRGGLLPPLLTNVIEFENRNAIILYCVLLYFQRHL